VEPSLPVFKYGLKSSFSFLLFIVNYIKKLIVVALHRVIWLFNLLSGFGVQHSDPKMKNYVIRAIETFSSNNKKKRIFNYQTKR
jgi:hypothetical protein